MTLTRVSNIFLDWTHLPCKYDQPTPSLRVSTAIPRFKLWPHISDPWGKNWKFWPLTFLRISILHIPVIWYWNLMRNLGGVHEFTQNRWTNENDLGVLDLWPMTLRQLGDVFLDRTYLHCKYDQPTPSLRVPYLPSQIWPLTPFIWPLGQKFKIPASYVFAYAHSAHSYQTILKSDE